MNIMTKQGSLDNVITYEHYCDTVADLQNIPKSQITLGSVAIVVNGESDGIEIYIADSHKQWTELTSMGGGSGDSSIYNLLHICAQDEYNSNTLIPTIEEPSDTIIYLVPGGSGNDLYQEWIYVNDNWEKFGIGNIALNAGDITFNNQEVYNSGTVGKELGDLKSQTNAISTATVTDVGKALSPKTVTSGKVTEWKFISAGGGVSDVQVNGTSILDAQGVANVPIASANDLGLIKIVDSTSGLYKTSANELRIASATDAAIKAGNNDYRPVVSANQHKSTFYGLAKAAGVDEKDSALSVGQYTDEAKSAIRNMLGAGGVQDVQINGISILYDQGVASIPMAGTNGVKLGVVALAQTYGLSRNASGRMYIVSASSSEIKNGEIDFKPIIPMHQHESTFYGLAKAAGDTTQSQSSNAVGTYTNEAKTAIRNMLGVETTTMFVENISGTTVTITGEPNTRYVCGEVLSISITPPQTGTIDVFFTAGSTVPVLTLPNTVVMPEWWTGVESGYTYEIVITDGVYGSVMAWPT